MKVSGLSLQSNIASQRALRRLGEADARLGQTLERLSTGLRILRASDDPAGLAVAATLDVTAKLSRQAERNIRDGVSAFEILDAALEQQSGILFRLSELAEQASNGSLSGTQRQALQVEYSKLVEEFSRVAATANFNGQNLGRADRSGLSQLQLQVGTNGSEAALLAASLVDTGEVSGTLGVDGLILDTGEAHTEFEELAASLPTSAEILSRYSTVQRINLGNSAGQELLLLFFGSPGSSIVMVRGLVQLEGEDRYDLASFDTPKVSTDFFSFMADPVTGVVTKGGQQASFDISGYHTGAPGGSMSYDYRALRLRQTGSSVIDFTGLENQERARVALDVVQTRIAELASARASIGAVSGRLQTSLAVASVTEQNTAAALSRIRDVDVAEESSAMLAQQILRNTAAAVLAQSNQQPGLVLRLLSDRGSSP